MVLEGYAFKSDDGQAWLAEVPCLDLMTQADTLSEVPEMVKDAIELHVDDPLFEVEVHVSTNQLLISANNPKKLIGLIRERQQILLRK